MLEKELVDPLKAYLEEALPKVCDADATALANYIIALLERDQTPEELKPSCVEKLEEFLTTETKPFVDKLFEFMASQRVVIDEKRKTTSTKRESPKRKVSRSRSRSRSRSGSKKRPRRRRESDRRGKRQRDAHRDSRRRDRDGERDREKDPEREKRKSSRERREKERPGREVREVVREVREVAGPPRERCPELMVKGSCTRGDACPFEHGETRPEEGDNKKDEHDNIMRNMAAMDPIWRGPNGPMFRNLPMRLPPDFVGPPPNMRFSPGGRPLVRPPLLPFGDLGKPFFPPGPGRRLPPLPNGAFLPRDFGVPPAPFPRPGEFVPDEIMEGVPNPPGGATEDVTGGNPPPSMAMLPPPQFRPNFPVFAAIPPPPRYETQYHRDLPLDVPPPPPPRPAQNKPFKAGATPPVPGTALYITDIPESIQFADLSAHFSKFGRIVNITLDTNRRRGMVRYETIEEANAAFSSPESVCGNRFIQVKWASDRRNNNTRTPQVPSPFPPTLANPSTNTTPTAPLLPTPSTPPSTPISTSPVPKLPPANRTVVPAAKKEQSAAAKSLAIEQLRRQLIQKQIQTQKTLFANFEATKHTLSAEAKAEMLARLNKLNDTLGESLKQATQASEAVGEAVGIARTAQPPEDRRAELDKELDQMISQGHHKEEAEPAEAEAERVTAEDDEEEEEEDDDDRDYKRKR